MGIIEILLISIGLSFDVFVVHICVGELLFLKSETFCHIFH